MTKPIRTRFVLLSRRLAALVGVLAAVVLATAAAPGQSLPRCPAGKPLTLDQVTRFLDQKIPEERTVGYLESCKVGFPVDAAALDRLLAAGASQPILAAVDRAAPLPSLDEAHTLVADLDKRAAAIRAAVFADRDRDLAKLEDDFHAQWDKAGHPAPKGEFESTAEYNARVQQDQANFKDALNRHAQERNRVGAEYAQKAEAKALPYTKRIASLKLASYPDPTPATYKSYNADTQVLTAEIRGETYLFENLPGKTAETLVHAWASVKLTQPYDGAETAKRTLLLASANIAAVGNTTQGKIASLLAEAKTLADAHDNAGAGEKYRKVLALDPANQAAKDGLAAGAEALAASQNQKLNELGIKKFADSPLVWSLRDNGRNLNWQAANNYCRNLRLGGSGNWRLPNIEELKQIRGSAKYGLQLSDRAASFWSSSLKHLGNLGPEYDEAWMINFAGFDGVSTGPVNLGGPGLDATIRALCVHSVAGIAAAALPVTSPNSASTATATDATNTTAYGATPAAEAAPSAPRLSPGDRDLLTAQANKLYDAQRFADALVLYEQTCASGNIYDCDRAGFMYSSGQGVPKDFAKAERLESKACDGGNPFGCNNLGYLEQTVDKDYVNASKHLAKACGAGNAAGCGSLAFQYEGGLGLPKDIAKAKELYGKGCKLGSQWSCQQSSRLQ